MMLFWSRWFGQSSIANNFRIEWLSIRQRRSIAGEQKLLAQLVDFENGERHHFGTGFLSPDRLYCLIWGCRTQETTQNADYFVWRRTVIWQPWNGNQSNKVCNGNSITNAAESLRISWSVSMKHSKNLYKLTAKSLTYNYWNNLTNWEQRSSAWLQYVRRTRQKCG
jgi:hypothetical protein